MNKPIINIKVFILLFFFLNVFASSCFAQKRGSKKEIPVKITFKLLKTKLFVGDTTTLVWKVIVPKGSYKVLLNGNIVENEGEQMFRVDSAATYTLTVELQNGNIRKRTLNIEPLQNGFVNKSLSKGSFFQELNKLRTSSFNCHTGKNDNYIKLNALEAIDGLSTIMDNVALIYKKKDEFCHEEKIEKVFAPLIEFYKYKNATVWVGIFSNSEINYSEYCKVIKQPQFKRCYIGVYTDVSFIVLEAPFSTNFNNEVMQGAKYGKALNNSQYYKGSNFSQHLLFSYSNIFGKPCNCDTVLVHIDKIKMLKLINETRAKGAICGTQVMPPVPPIKWNDTLEMVAFLHSKSMCVNDHYNHIGIDGSDPTDRASRLWYKYALGENIARGYTDEESVFKGWLNSPGHCENMLNIDKHEVGVARNGIYWTMNLGYKFVSREYEAKVRQRNNEKEKRIINEIVLNINKYRSSKLSINRIYPYYISSFSEKGLPDDYNRGVQLYGGVELNCTDFKTQQVLKSINDNPRYLELIKDTIYTDIMIEPTIMDTRIIVYRPLSKIRMALIAQFEISNVLEKRELNDLAFRQAKIHYYGLKESLKNIDFAPGTLKQMIEREKINCKQYEMILVKDSSIHTEDNLMEYIITHPEEAEKITKYKYNQIGYARYNEVWSIVIVKCEQE